MKQVIGKARVLIEALPYIQRFKGETVVVKFGGSALEERAQYENVLRDVSFMAVVGMKPVIVHGGGKAISRKLKEAQVPTRFVHGLRVTDEATVKVVQQVLGKEVNADIVATLRKHGCLADGIMGEEILTAVKHHPQDPRTGEELDLGLVGEAVAVDTGPVRAFTDRGIVPVITPLGRDPRGQLYNINADQAAATVAESLKARKLVFLSDVPGLCENPEDPDTLMSTLSTSQVEALIRKGVIDGGMKPKVASAVKALEAGVRKVHFVDAALPHSLLLELFTDKGVGTEIVA